MMGSVSKDMWTMGREPLQRKCLGRDDQSLHLGGNIGVGRDRKISAKEKSAGSQRLIRGARRGRRR